jgi:hypothetical protein
METTLSVINTLPSGKEQVTSFVRMFKSELLEGTKKPLPVLVQLKYAEATIKEILSDKEIDNCFLKEFLLYDKDEKVEIQGASLRCQEVGTKYDYKASGDLQWIELDEQITKLTEQRKEREKFLITIPLEGVTDEKTGLYITRPSKSSTTKVVVTLKK